jgi:glyoxylase-like metal-dependent hydrolase (beta-lactamase superfamily II)
MARRLCEGLWLLDLGLVPPLATNVYLYDEALAGGGAELVLVDTGLPVNYPTLHSEFAAAGYDPADLDRVLLTHYDLDHVGGLRRLGPTGATIHLGEPDLSLARGEWDPPWLHHKGAFHRLVRPLFDLSRFAVTPVTDGEQVGRFTVYHTPGHNPGHVVYVHEPTATAFLGDLVWEEAGGFTTPFWLDSYDMRQLRESVRAFAATTEFDRGLVAHGEPILADASARLRELAEGLQ